ncbi:CCHC-type domain-containing protein [Trichonephila clavipes]|nr:CCHC-type domain-containing protein [Trichonephila clavipes]
MREDEKVSHLMKGVAENIYQALLTREINDTASFIKWCNYIEDMKQKRVGRPRFERLPNVVPVASMTDETDLVSLIRTIVREEVHRLVNQTQESLDSDPQSLEEIVQDEVERVLAPVSTKPTETRPRPTYAAVTRKYRAPVQKFPPQPRKTDVWRTADNRPVCFHCGRPGHVMRYCRERRLSLTTLETADGTSTTLALKKKYADQTLLAVLRQVPREADPQYVVTDPRRHIADPVSRQANNSITGYQTRGDINVVLDGSKHLLFEKNIATPSMVSTYRNGKSDVWVTNLQFRNQIIPRGMCIGQAEPLNEGHLCVISDTSGCLDASKKLRSHR